jgi:hypothetical protein
VTAKRIEVEGHCSVCGGHKVKLAYWHGYNMPKPIEWISLLFAFIWRKLTGRK